MKHLFIVFLLITSISFAQTQNSYTHSLKGIKKVVIKSKESMFVLAKDISDLKITDNAFQHNPPDYMKKKDPNKTKGLKAIYPGGKDNTNGLGFAITKEENTLIIKDLKSSFQRHGTQFELPKNIDITLDLKQTAGAEIIGFSSEIEANSSVGKLDFKNVTGPITAHSSTGDIKIVFSNVNQTSPITITSSVSEIDIALPANTKASLDMKTNGTVYTNFDLKAEPKDGLQNLSSKKITGNINNGGVKIKLKSSMGNIYLRKK